MLFILPNTADLLFPLIPSFLCSHNLEYDSSEEKNPHLIFYNQKDEVVKVRCEFRDLLHIRLLMRLIPGVPGCQDRFMQGSLKTQIVCQIPSHTDPMCLKMQD